MCQTSIDERKAAGESVAKMSKNTDAMETCRCSSGNPLRSLISSIWSIWRESLRASGLPGVRSGPSGDADEIQFRVPIHFRWESST